MLVVIAWLAAAFLAPFGDFSPNEVDLERILAPPGWERPLGSDELGRPVLDRLLIGARTSFLAAVWVVGVSALVGTLIGISAGFFGGWLDLAVVRVIDLFLAFPGILLAIALAGMLGPGLGNLILALIAVGWVGFARLARVRALAIAGLDHVQSAQALGCRSFSILRRHVLPLTFAPLIVEATFGIAGVVIAEAGLSFLGLGVQPPDASWGSMLRDGVSFMLVAPHLVLAPGAAILFVVLAVNRLGDALRDHLDVRLPPSRSRLG